MDNRYSTEGNMETTIILYDLVRKWVKSAIKK